MSSNVALLSIQQSKNNSSIPSLLSQQDREGKLRGARLDDIPRRKLVDGCIDNIFLDRTCSVRGWLGKETPTPRARSSCREIEHGRIIRRRRIHRRTSGDERRPPGPDRGRECVLKVEPDARQATTSSVGAFAVGVQAPLRFEDVEVGQHGIGVGTERKKAVRKRWGRPVPTVKICSFSGTS